MKDEKNYKNAFLKEILDNAPYIIIVLDTQGKILFFNKYVENITGYSAKEVLGREWFEIFISSKNRKKLKKVFSSILEENKLFKSYENEILTKNNGKRIIKWSNNLIKRKNSLILSIGEDITEKIKTEEKLIQHLANIQKLEALGTLAGGIAHDFNNILNIITGYLDIIKKKCSLKNKKNECIEIIKKASLRGISLVNQLLTFARRTEPIISPYNLNDIIMDLTKIVYETFPKNILLNLELKEDIPIIFCDSNQLYQVFLNLLINAKDAMPKGGKISIVTEIVSGKNLKERFFDALSENYIEIKISDTGTGMDERTLERIFEPFFTTKELGKGTGLGLSTAYSIIRNHNGFIDVKSKIGEGTTFFIYLPIKDFDIQTEEKKIAFPEVPKGKGETILIVEDEEMLLNLLKNILKTNEYNILEATDGKMALELYRKNKEIISCVICDMGLPFLSGEEVFKEIKKINPKEKVIMVSGLIDLNLKSELLKNGAFDIIQKPYNLNEILYKLKMALQT